MKKRSKAETERFYRELIAEHARSGLTIREFATRRGVPTGTMSFWRFELKRRDALRAKRKARRRPSFLPVKVVDAVKPTEPAAQPPKKTAGGYEVVLGRDRVVRVPLDFDEERVAALVRVVASC